MVHLRCLGSMRVAEARRATGTGQPVREGSDVIVSIPSRALDGGSGCVQHPLMRSRQGPRGRELFDAISTSLIRPRERFVELPSLGRPTPEEVNWRLHSPPGSLRGARDAVMRAITIEQWFAYLEGTDVPWALRAVRYLRWIIARHEERIMHHAFDHGYGWDELGSYLGVSRQAVAQRWGERLWPREPPAPRSAPGPPDGSSPGLPDGSSPAPGTTP